MADTDALDRPKKRKYVRHASESAKKRIKLERERARKKTRISIGAQKQEWDLLKKQKGLTLDSDVAKLLLTSELAPWVRDIKTHFWYCAENANGSENKFLAMWRGLLHHICNVHKWALGECAHEDLDDQVTKPWLKPDSPAHEALAGVMLKTLFLNNIRRYVNFRHTGTLESFHNHILMYASKRFSFRYNSYIARNQLAAIDYQEHKDRDIQKDKKGNVRYHRTYNKRSGQWSVVPVKSAKLYGYINKLKANMVKLCLDDKKPIHRHRTMAASDPRRLSSTIAPVAPPSTKELVLTQKSRFVSKSPKKGLRKFHKKTPNQ